MKERHYDVAVIGGGSAGMAAASVVRQRGYTAAIFEREEYLGGILMQCIHSGFGLHEFGEDLTGPEFAERFISRVLEAGADVYTDTTVMDLRAADKGAGGGEGAGARGGKSGGHLIRACSRRSGVMSVACRAVVLAMGCRERNRGNVAIAGTRPAGVFTAGLVQRLVNIEGYIPGRRAVIVGSGDIGLIMARRLTMVGVEIPAVIEIQPYPSGTVRNIVQCLNDFGIPLYLSHVVSRITGQGRVDGVEVTPLVDGKPDYGKSFRIPCDTVLLSVGLIPENELSRSAGIPLSGDTGGPFVDADLQTGVPGVFACGNVLHVHDLVDFASEEARRCGEAVCRSLSGEKTSQMKVSAGANVRYVVPNSFAVGRENVFYLRSLVVKNDAVLSVKAGGVEIRRRKLAHVQPSEMIKLVLAPQDMPPASPPSAQPVPTMEVSIL